LSHAVSSWQAVSGTVRGGPADRIALLRRAAAAASATGDYGTAVDRLQEALDLLDPEQDPLTTSAVLVDWTRAVWEDSPGQRWYRPEIRVAVGLTDRAPDSAERAMALGRLAEAQVWDDTPDVLDRPSSDGRTMPGSSAAEEAVAVASRSGSPLALAHAFTAHAMTLLPDPA